MDTISQGVSETAKNIVRVASKEHEQKGLSGAVGGVLRQIAPTVCVPIILSSQATSSVLDGFISQLEPESKKDAAQKWKG
jgi:autophagy-related protein 2